MGRRRRRRKAELAGRAGRKGPRERVTRLGESSSGAKASRARPEQRHCGGARMLWGGSVPPGDAEEEEGRVVQPAVRQQR